MNRFNWYRGTMAAVALSGTLALLTILGTHAGAFAADNDPGAAPEAPPNAAGDPPGPPPALAADPPGPPPPSRDGDQGEQWQDRRGGREQGDRGGWDRQGPPRDSYDRQGPPRDSYDRQGPGLRGGEFDDQNGPPPGPRFRDGGRGQDEGRGRPCPREASGDRQDMRQDGFEPPRPPDPDQMFESMDKNRDGMISKDEFRAFADQHRPPRPPMYDRSDDRRPAPPQRPSPQDDRPQG